MKKSFIVLHTQELCQDVANNNPIQLIVLTLGKIFNFSHHPTIPPPLEEEIWKPNQTLHFAGVLPFSRLALKDQGSVNPGDERPSLI